MKPYRYAHAGTIKTPPRRGPRSRGEAAEVILEAISCDRWLSAAEIAAETEMSSLKVAHIIRRSLLGVDVERRPTGRLGRKLYLYRRLRRVDASRRTSDS